MAHKKTYHVVTLGCRTNQYESQAYTNQLQTAGYEKADEGEADICIINTCTVTENADKKSFYAIRKSVRDFKPKKLIVTGCLAKKDQKTIRAIPGVSDVVFNENKQTLLPDLFDEEQWPEFKINQFEAHTRAFVKVQDGCNSYCSYCVIPFVRGRSTSKTLPQVLDEVHALVENGYREVVLTGINIGDFCDGEKRLADLVREVDQVEGLRRVRISSIDPDEVDAELIDAVANGKNTCDSMHIVLQSGSNPILKRMRRGYLMKDVYDAYEKLSKVHPLFTITTDVIVGFPGETEADFEQTVQVIQKLPFVKVHIFPYSDRPKTRASRMEDKVDSATIERRKKKLLEVSRKRATQIYERYLRLEVEVLFETEEVQKEGQVWMMGHTTHFIPVFVEKGSIRSGEIYKVRLGRIVEGGIFSEVINES